MCRFLLDLRAAMMTLAVAGVAWGVDAQPAKAGPPGGQATSTPAAEKARAASDAAAPAAQGADQDATAQPPRRAEQFQRLSPPDATTFPDLKSLSPEHDVWIDAKNRRVVLRGGVCLREGPVELFACIHQWVADKNAPGGKTRRGTKEYESVLTINTTAALVHTALLAVGAQEGDPVEFAPEYKPATGSEIQVMLHWTSAGAPKQAPAQQWLRNTKTRQAMANPWVFAGSRFVVNEETNQRQYLGEDGNLICVSNFSDAVLDVPVPSTAANSALLFEAFTENIPPLGTPVTIVLTPRQPTKAKGGAGPAESKQ